MRAKVAAAVEHKITQGLGQTEADYAQLKLIDSVQFAADTLLPKAHGVNSPAVAGAAPYLLDDSLGRAACI